MGRWRDNSPPSPPLSSQNHRRLGRQGLVRRRDASNVSASTACGTGTLTWQKSPMLPGACCPQHWFLKCIYYSCTLFNEDEMSRACNMNGAKRNACRILVGKLEGKRPLGWRRHRCVGIIKWILDRRGDMDWIDLAQDRDHWTAPLNTVMNLVP
jgi:hypothetical protein